VDNFYVYYRVDMLQRHAALTAVNDILDKVQTRCGIRGSLLQRADDAATWMEVYEDIGDTESFRQTLDEIVTDSGLLNALACDSTRHVEHFRAAS
jgi:hypothetical protein